MLPGPHFGGCSLSLSRTALSRRGLVLMLALATVVIAWPIERQVSELRHARNATSDLVMRQASASPAMQSGAAKTEWESAKAEFATWHLWSLLLNFVTILLVTIAMALTAQLPGYARLQS